MDIPYIVGVDAGGTKTHLRFATVDGVTVKDVVRPAGDWTNLDARGKARLLVDGILDNSEQPPLAIGIGAHGCDSDAECEELRVAVEDELHAPASVVNDALLLQFSVDGDSCASVVVGTGSIAVAYSSAGSSLYSGGWGWLIGDPASGWGTVREAVRELSTAQNRGDRGTDPLLEALLTRSETRSLREIVGLMQSSSPRSWAAWAPIVFDAAANGSPAARTAIDRGAEALVELVGDLIARGAVVEKVIAGGSVIVNQPMLEERMAHYLDATLGLPLTVFAGNPVHGAVRLALRSR